MRASSSKSPGFLNRSNKGSKSMSRKSLAFLSKDKEGGSQAGDTPPQNGSGSVPAQDGGDKSALK